MRPSRLPRAHAALLLAVTLAACGGDDRAGAASSAGDAGGTIVIAQPEPDNLLPPFTGSVQAQMVTELVYDRLAELDTTMVTVGDAGFRPRLARRWDWSADSLSIAFELDPDARWHDGRPVRARDVAWTLALYKNAEAASPHAGGYANVDSITARDSLTAVAWFKRRTPEQFYQLAHNLHPLPSHLLDSIAPARLAQSAYARRPVGSGRFRLDRWEAGQRIVLVADSAHYRGRPNVDRVVLLTLTDFSTGPTRLFAGEADVVDQLRPENVTELARHKNLQLVRYAGLDYAFMQFNLQDRARPRPHPIFGDRAVRRALTMALDRQGMVRAVLDSLAVPAIGPVTRAMGVADTTVAQLPYDTARARAVLDSLGWRDGDGDGIREKAGRPLRFTLLLPGTSKSRIAYGVLIQEQLRRVGVGVEIDQVDFNAFLQREVARDFDAVLGAWHTDPSPAGLRTIWGSVGAVKGGQNFGMYRSPTFDAHVDSALATFDARAARAHFRAAHETIVADAPAVWLYEMRPALGAHKRIRVTGVRPDAWWAGIADWRIPSDERLPRDGAVSVAANQ